MTNKKQIIITGINGFVGKNLKPYLSKSFNVTGVSRTVNKNDINFEMFHREDILYDTIVHLAGKAHDLKKTTAESEYYEVNYELTKKLYDQFLQSNAERFIYISSVKAAADSIEGILTEEQVPCPITIYGKSKRMAEEYILANLPKDKKVFILRPCMIHGPGNKGNLNLLFSLIRKGFPWPLGAFDNKRSFCSIENLCFVIKELLENDTIISGVYNVADDTSLSTNDLIKLIAFSQKKKQKILPISKTLIKRIAKTGDFLKLPLNTERLDKLTESYEVSNKKIITAIGKPMPIDSKVGLLKTFESFL
jgi:nucleoside-diphosphate-sugar epimerase